MHVQYTGSIWRAGRVDLEINYREFEKDKRLKPLKQNLFWKISDIWDECCRAIFRKGTYNSNPIAIFGGGIGK